MSHSNCFASWPRATKVEINTSLKLGGGGIRAVSELDKRPSNGAEHLLCYVVNEVVHYQDAAKKQRAAEEVHRRG